MLMIDENKQQTEKTRYPNGTVERQKAEEMKQHES